MNEISDSDEQFNENNDIFATEVEVLQAICEEPIELHKEDGSSQSELSILLHPATAGNKDAQYVCLRLIIQVPNQYPNECPVFKFKNARGMSEEELERILTDLKELSEARRGSEMLYDIIQAAKDSLTENNSPSLPCAICQCPFEADDAFTKTECYHYFHSYCLGRCLQFSQENEQQDICPICRKPLLGFDHAQLLQAPEPKEEGAPTDAITMETRRWQEEMKVLFERQKVKGGHIDPEEESNRNLISIRNIPTTTMEEMLSQQLRNSTLNSADKEKGKTGLPQEEQRNSARPGSGGNYRANQSASHPSDRRDDRSRFGGDRRGGHGERHHGSGGRGRGRGRGRGHTGSRDSSHREDRPQSGPHGHRQRPERWERRADKRYEKKEDTAQQKEEREKKLSEVRAGQEVDELRQGVREGKSSSGSDNVDKNTQLDKACSERAEEVREQDDTAERYGESEKKGFLDDEKDRSSDGIKAEESDVRKGDGRRDNYRKDTVRGGSSRGQGRAGSGRAHQRRDGRIEENRRGEDDEDIYYEDVTGRAKRGPSNTQSVSGHDLGERNAVGSRKQGRRSETLSKRESERQSRQEEQEKEHDGLEFRSGRNSSREDRGNRGRGGEAGRGRGNSGGREGGGGGGRGGGRRGRSDGVQKQDAFPRQHGGGRGSTRSSGRDSCDIQGSVQDSSYKQKPNKNDIKSQRSDSSKTRGEDGGSEGAKEISAKPHNQNQEKHKMGLAPKEKGVEESLTKLKGTSQVNPPPGFSAKTDIPKDYRPRTVKPPPGFEDFR
ncbi:uncharacterized protein [Diadema setosum]|uniref:uncharacterized protein n=1 Tax=Diadema setosum TaxID=31175 RepID=UPI003B3A67A3